MPSKSKCLDSRRAVDWERTTLQAARCRPIIYPVLFIIVDLHRFNPSDNFTLWRCPPRHAEPYLRFRIDMEGERGGCICDLCWGCAGAWHSGQRCAARSHPWMEAWHTHGVRAKFDSMFYASSLIVVKRCTQMPAVVFTVKTRNSIRCCKPPMHCCMSSKSEYHF